MRFVSFVFGAFAATLILLSLVNSEILLKGEMLGRNLIWYLTITGAIAALSRALVPDENATFQAEKYMRKLEVDLYFISKRWLEKAHTLQVRDEFLALFKPRLIVLLEEMLGVLITPFMLLFMLPNNSEKIVEFFQKFTVYVDGVGYICSFANFSFIKHGNKKYGATKDAPKELKSRHGKMEKSFIQFKAEYPSWQPAPDAEEVIYNLSEYYRNSQIENSFFKDDSKAYVSKEMISSLKPRDLERIQQQYRERRIYAHDRVNESMTNEPSDSLILSDPV